MQICTNCGTENLDGVVFCEKCGVALVAVSIGTKQLGGESPMAAGGERLDEENIILLHIHGEQDPLAIQVTDRVILGRTGGETDNAPLINLDEHDAENHGVSRRHAMLTREGDRLYISDLGSTNHTYLNGNQLQEHDNLVLRDGDELTLGHMRMKVFYK
ncbi:MAG: FHA domain-containing protein [Chloroflexi bacterium]|nr:FHA domain-containing protein [Chloroflexota bacterium]